MALVGNEWLVADSEDEDAFAQLPPANGFGASAATRDGPSSEVSAIQTADFTSDQPCTPPRGPQSPLAAGGSLFTPPPPAGTDLTIGDFTSVPSTSIAPLAVVPRPRPRPRVVIKKAAISEPNADAANTSFSHISDLSTPATRRTDDSIHPATSTSFGLSDAVDDIFSFDIAERAKMRSRKSQTSKKPVKPVPQIAEVIELTSDEDELALKPTKRQRKQVDPIPKPQVQTRPRPKPRLKVKPAAALPSGTPPSSTVALDPLASVLPPRHESSPQLPASTLPTIPPSTPPQARELTPLSSPIVTTRKRKRVCPLVAEDDDEMDIIRGDPTRVPSSSAMPPPFFAPPSSSVPTDSGIELPPDEPVSSRGRKKQGPSGKKGTQKKTQNKGRKGKKGETTAVNEIVENSTGVTQEPSTLATHQSLIEEPLASVKYTGPAEKTSRNRSMEKGKARAIDSEEEDELALLPRSGAGPSPSAGEGAGGSKENLRPDDPSPPRADPPLKHTPTPSLYVRGSPVKLNSTPMSELIRRVNSHPSSPFPNVSRTYSPFLKSSRTMLSRIAPLHPNRRTPPPPLPRPPPPKKSKKQLEMEERIEEELVETVDGWSCLTDDERKALRKARIDAEMGYEE